jgi:hypothetical protein
MRLFLKLMIPLLLWIFLLYVIGLSVHKHWGSPYGWTIPMAFFTLGLRELIKTMKNIIGTSDKKDSAPRTNQDYTITEEDIHKDLHEGRE